MSEAVVFGTFSGTFQNAPAGHACPVLMLSPFGFEELCGRAFWRKLAEQLAAAGVPSLRFDYPGTADALDNEATGIDDWRAATLEAADWLRRRTGAATLSVLGQSLGATLAAHWLPELLPVSTLVLLEPALTGRTYLRGLKAWGAAVAASSGLALTAQERVDHSVAGFALAPARAAAIRALDLRETTLPRATDMLVFEQAGGTTGKVIQAIGNGTVEFVPFPEYASLTTDPTSAVFPAAASARIVARLAASCRRRSETGLAGACATPAGIALAGDGFSERPVRFGPAGRLTGILCGPTRGGAPSSAVVIANGGRDHHIGWARGSVSQARALARAGTVSLRIDVSGLGDSPEPEGSPGEILYSERMCLDVRAALDHLGALGFTSLGLVGRCSGAWAAFTVALRDPRVHTLALVNPGYFFWDPSQTLSDVLGFAQRRLGDLPATLLSRQGLSRLLRGDLDWRGARRFLMASLHRRLLGLFAALGRHTRAADTHRAFHAAWHALDARAVRVLLAYSQGDASLETLRSYMGSRLQRLAHYANTTVRVIPEADHNFTAFASREALQEQLREFLLPDDAVRQSSPKVDDTASSANVRVAA